MDTKLKQLQLSSHEERLVNSMQVLGDVTRYKMFKMLLDDKDLCVSEIAGQLGISVAAVSQHFRIFELVGLVDKTRHGQKICYSLKRDDTLVKSFVKISHDI